MCSLGTDNLFLSLTSSKGGKVSPLWGKNNFTIPGESNKNLNKSDVVSNCDAIDAKQISPRYTNMVEGYEDPNLPTKVFTA